MNSGFVTIGSVVETPYNRDALPQGYTPRVGDVVIEVGSIPKNQHEAMWNGAAWVSDTVQQHIDPYQHDPNVTATFYSSAGLSGPKLRGPMK